MYQMLQYTRCFNTPMIATAYNLNAGMHSVISALFQGDFRLKHAEMTLDLLC